MVSLKNPILREIEQLLRPQFAQLPALRQHRILKGLRVIDDDLALLDMLGRTPAETVVVSEDTPTEQSAAGASLAVGGKGGKRRE